MESQNTQKSEINLSIKFHPLRLGRLRLYCKLQKVMSSRGNWTYSWILAHKSHHTMRFLSFKKGGRVRMARRATPHPQEYKYSKYYSVIIS